MARKRLGEILVEAGVLAEAQLRAALAEQRRWGGPLGRILVDMKLITEDAMVAALSHQLNFPSVNLDQVKIDRSVTDLIGGDQAEQFGVIPFAMQGKFLDVAMADPTNLGVIDELRIRTRLNVHPYLAGPKAIERALARYYGRGVPSDPHASPGSMSTAMPLHTRMVDPDPRVEEWRPAASSSVRRRVGIETGPATAIDPPAAVVLQSAPRDYSREIVALQERVQRLEALITRDEDVLRKLLALFIEKGLFSREEILERIK
jgi:type IV pilus assembly protein PilB